MCLFRRKQVGKIYKTTDGYFANNPKNKKTRHVVVVDQRSFDGAIAVAKIHSKKEGRKGCIDNIVLSPKKHKVLKQNSVVERRVIHGIKRNNKFQPIYRRELTGTKSKLGFVEFAKLRRELGGRTQKEKNVYRSTRRKWHKGFSNKKK